MDSDWTSLPVNLLDLISEKLKSTRDYLQFEAVCSSWNSVAKYNVKKRTNNSSSHECPLLMIPSENGHLHDLYDVTTRKLLNSKLLVPFNGRFCGSSQGWLLTLNIKDFSLTLYKPSFTVNRERSSIITIPLPILNIIKKRDRHRAAHVVKKFAISADPLKNPNQCMILIFCTVYGRLAYIRPAKDKKWRYIDSDLTNSGVSDIISYNEQFYVYSLLQNLVTFEVVADGKAFKLIPKLIGTTPFESICETRYLVELNGKPLLVERYLSWDITIKKYQKRVHSRETVRVIVYELESDWKSWKETEDIGDFALFLGDNTSMSVLASNFDGCKSNCIYFTHDHDGVHSTEEVVNDFGVYDIASGVMNRNVNLDADTLKNVSNRSIPIWIEPYEINQS